MKNKPFIWTLVILIATLAFVMYFSTSDEDRTEHTNIIDAGNIKVGDSVAGMEVVAVDLTKALGQEHEYTGTIQFSGTAQVTGTYSYTKTDAMHGEIFSFTLDPDSLHAIPILSYDQRTQWFVFTNLKDAKQMFEIGDDVEAATGTATIIIEDFLINYQYSSVFNTAKLSDVISQSKSEKK